MDKTDYTERDRREELLLELMHKFGQMNDEEKKELIICCDALA